MDNLIFRLREKLFSLNKKQRLIFILITFFILLSLGLILISKKEIKEEKISPVAPLPSQEIKPKLSRKIQSLPERVIKKVTQLIGLKKEIEVQKPKEVSPTPEPKTRFSGSEIPKAAIDYLDKQKRADGFYNFYTNYEDLCVNNYNPLCGLVDERNMGEGANMWTILARTTYYNKFSHHPTDLVKAEEDARVLMNYCQADPLLCLPGSVVPFINLYNATKNDEYKLFLSHLGQALLSNEIGQDTMDFAMVASELAELSKVFSDQTYLNKALQILNQAERVSAKMVELDDFSAKQGIDINACYITLAQVRVGIAGSDGVILGRAKDFFEKKNQEKIPPELTLIDPCIEAAFLLANHTNDANMRQGAHQLLDYYVTHYWDGPGLGKSYEQGGFVKNLDPRWVNITDTGYMIYLLGFAPEKTYDFGKN